MDFVPLGLEDDDASEKIEIQPTFVISTSAMSNSRLSRGENLVRALTWKSYNEKKILWIRGEIAHNEQFLSFSKIFSVRL